MTVRAPISAMPDDELRCRGNRNHWWDANPNRTVDSDLAKAATFVVTERCIHGCGRERISYFNKAWELIIPRRYIYPPNHRRYEPTTAHELRAEMFSRSLLINRLDPKPTRKPRKRRAA